MIRLNCDICGREVDSVERLNTKYTDGIAKHGCAPCTKEMENLLFQIEKTAERVVHGWFRSFFRSKVERKDFKVTE